MCSGTLRGKAMIVCVERKERFMGEVTTVLLMGVLLTSLTAASCAGNNAALSHKAIDARIQKHRTTEVTLTVTDVNDKPLVNSEVVVPMRRNKLLFGCNLYR